MQPRSSAAGGSPTLLDACRHRLTARRGAIAPDEPQAASLGAAALDRRRARCPLLAHLHVSRTRERIKLWFTMRMKIVSQPPKENDVSQGDCPVLAAACLAAGLIWWSQRPETSTVSVGTDSAAPAASQTSGLPAGESFDGVATVGRFVLTYANADRQGKEQRDSVAYMSLDGGRTFERSKAFPNDAFRLAVGASGPNEFLVVGSTCTAVSDEEQLPCGLGDRLTIRYDAVADSVSAVDPAPAGDVWDLIDDDTTIGPVAVITGPEGLVTAFALSNDQKWAPIELPKSTSALCGTRTTRPHLDQAVVTTPTTPLETIPVAPGGETATWTVSDSGDGWSVTRVRSCHWRRAIARVGPSDLWSRWHWDRWRPAG